MDYFRPQIPRKHKFGSIPGDNAPATLEDLNLLVDTINSLLPLPLNIQQALVAANLPSITNPYATLSDISVGQPDIWKDDIIGIRNIDYSDSPNKGDVGNYATLYQYQFDITSFAIDNGITVLKPHDAGLLPGRWIKKLELLDTVLTQSISNKTIDNTNTIINSGSNGLVLLTLGVPSVALPGTDYITGGTGSANQVAYFTGSGTIEGSNNHIWDNTNKKLTVIGLGNTGTNTVLDIQSSTNSVFSIKDNGTIVGKALSVDITTNYNVGIGYGIGVNYTTANENVAIGTYANKECIAGIGGVFIGSQAGQNNKSNFAVFIGYQAGYYYHKTGPTGNTAVGNGALYSTTTGDENTAIGCASLQATNGNFNTALGWYSGYGIISGTYNIAVGHSSLYGSITGSHNIGLGYQTGYSLTSGSYNILQGKSAGYSLISGSNNIMLGQGVGAYATGSFSVLIGFSAGSALTTGDEDIFIGKEAGQNATGVANVIIGSEAGKYSGSGDLNIYVGYRAGLNTGNGSNNIAIGFLSLGNSTTSGTENVLIGTKTGYGLSSGSYNILQGYQAGFYLLSGNNNVFLGCAAGKNQTINSNLLIIDNQDRTTDVLELTNALIYGIFDASVANQRLNLNANVGIGGGGNATATSPLNITNIPTSAVGLSPGDVWNNGGILTII